MLIFFIRLRFSTVLLVIFVSVVEMETSRPIPSVRFKKKTLQETAEERSSLMDLSKEELVQRIINLKHELTVLRFKAEKKNVPTNATETSKKKFDITKCKTRHIALKILYQGFNYNGFQAQKITDNTIAEHLFKALQKTCLVEDKDRCNYSCSGRTDAGVSAFSQVCTLTVRSKLTSPGADDSDELPYVKMLSSNLPKDIRVVAWSSVPENFSARFDCLYRNYKYWFPQSGLDIDAMNEAALMLVGTHDFRNLCKMNVANGVVNFKRTVTNASVQQAFHNNQFNDNEHNICEFHIRSQGFLWHQIRCVMSILFLVGEGKEKPDIVRQLCDIDKCPSKPVYPMVIGEPLNLYSTEYNPDSISWHYDQTEVGYLLRGLHKDWSLHSIKATMLGEMIRDTIRESQSTEGSLNISHLVEGIAYKQYTPLMSRDKCESLDNRIQHYIKKRKLEVISDCEENEGAVE